MNILPRLYEVVRRKPAPHWMRRSGAATLIWKLIRKWLSVRVIPFCTLNCIRIRLYRLVGFRIGEGVFIGMRCYLDDMVPERTIIEDHVTVSYCCVFAAHGPGAAGKDIILRTGSYIGTNVTLLGGAEVGPYTVIGAGSLVNKPVPPFSVAVGVPARVIRDTPIPGTTQHNEWLKAGKPTGTPEDRQ